MPSYLSPGIYPRETDFSFYVKQLSTSACGMIGVAEKGPINDATLVASWEQFLRAFGGYLAAGYLAYAARAFFDNGGGVLWITRIAHATDPTDPATITLEEAVALIDARAGKGASKKAAKPKKEKKAKEPNGSGEEAAAKPKKKAAAKKKAAPKKKKTPDAETAKTEE